MAPRGRPAAIPVHITELRMSAPPKQSLPVPVNIQTAIMRVPNIPPAFYRFLYTQVGRRWQWVERLRMDDETLAAILNDKRTNVTVLYVDGAPAGFFELFQRDTESMELVHFGLFEHALGLGLGKWFLLQTLYAAWAADPTSLSVTTNNLDHPRALQLYQMFGFSPVSTREATILPLSEAELLELARRA
ncbi:GNAT family N-acetyltransferase [Rhizobium sp. ARZ01]|uniref:GNAT family N-acetyltransferase n=1 Tax=Rhizobium sp. ARZ01 TaxID=2769313 RepID=UPI001FEEFBD0|nr:GNAT family N-acetyltransferase [Rhizobium sp. ARZ01]